MKVKIDKFQEAIVKDILNQTSFLGKNASEVVYNLIDIGATRLLLEALPERKPIYDEKLGSNTNVQLIAQRLKYLWELGAKDAPPGSSELIGGNPPK